MKPSGAQHDLTLLMRNLAEKFYLRDAHFSFHTAKTHLGLEWSLFAAMHCAIISL
jgi:hypothetical protein